MSSTTGQKLDFDDFKCPSKVLISKNNFKKENYFHRKSILNGRILFIG
jgi:hypothetical protein